MALDLGTLKDDIREALENPNTENNVETVVDKLATAIDKYVKSGDVEGVTADGKTVTGKLV